MIKEGYESLRVKREAEILTEHEYQTLIQLGNEIEIIGAQRLEALVSLAQCWQMSLNSLMKKLGIECEYA